MKEYRFIVLWAIIFSLSSSLYAQKDSTEVENPISISCDLMSRYVWRGTDFGASPSIQLGVEYSKSGFAIGAWGAYAINFQGYQESDLYIKYTFHKEIFTVMVTDYYFQSDLVSQNYFDYKKLTTGHVFEAALTFNGTEKLPLSLMIATNVYGADSKKINDDGTVGENQYSTYAELTYSFKHFDIFMGTNLTQVDRDKGESGYYGNYMGVVNLGITITKEIKITSYYNLPLTVSLITNPQAEKVYLVAGFSF
ncbi:MAG: hypothetical protein QM495_10595 [Lutibacter sp.]|uniref:hypothetical protein n=1 Tax=Lutibacter sp. TaxID=1925666 RepID=UPI0038592C7D